MMAVINHYNNKYENNLMIVFDLFLFFNQKTAKETGEVDLEVTGVVIVMENVINNTITIESFFYNVFDIVAGNNENGAERPKVTYIPKDIDDTEELFDGGITSGINFDNYENIVVEVNILRTL